MLGVALLLSMSSYDFSPFHAVLSKFDIFGMSRPSRGQGVEKCFGASKKNGIFPRDNFGGGQMVNKDCSVFNVSDHAEDVRLDFGFRFGLDFRPPAPILMRYLHCRF